MGMKKRRQKCLELVSQYYSDVPSRMEMFDLTLSGILRSSNVLLDAGCGSDIPLLSKYAPRVSLALGIDLCMPSVQTTGRTQTVVGNLEDLPLLTGVIDTVISHEVFEHLRDPVHVFKELNRVLRSGGKLVFVTPNKYYYTCLLARIIPESLKSYYFRIVFGEDAFDHFHVYYRANSLKAFQKFANTAKFRILNIEAIRHYPYYLMFSPLLFRLGIYYDQLITALGLKWLQSNWLVVMEKE